MISIQTRVLLDKLLHQGGQGIDDRGTRRCIHLDREIQIGGLVHRGVYFACQWVGPIEHALCNDAAAAGRQLGQIKRTGLVGEQVDAIQRVACAVITVDLGVEQHTIGHDAEHGIGLRQGRAATAAAEDTQQFAGGQAGHHERALRFQFGQAETGFLNRAVRRSTGHVVTDCLI